MSFDLEAYFQLCRFPFLQDEQCNLPARHAGDHERINTMKPDPHCPHCGEPGHEVACDDCYKEMGAG